jgi:hypothetical protein
MSTTDTPVIHNLDHDCTAERVLVGGAHPRYRYDVRTPEGRRIGTVATLSRARALVAEYGAEVEDTGNVDWVGVHPNQIDTVAEQLTRVITATEGVLHSSHQELLKLALSNLVSLHHNPVIPDPTA